MISIDIELYKEDGSYFTSDVLSDTSTNVFDTQAIVEIVKEIYPSYKFTFLAYDVKTGEENKYLSIK